MLRRGGRSAATFCELRALVELVKLQQATLDGLTLISLDCPVPAS